MTDVDEPPAELSEAGGAGAASVDLTPRPVTAAGGSRNRRWMAWVALVAVLGGIGFVLYRGLSNATVFFYNADDAVRLRSETGDRRIRIQGDVVKESVVKHERGVSFDLRYGGVVVGVDNSSDPPDLFGPAIPVVVEGRWNGERFAGDKILVKHDENYTSNNKARIECAQDAARADASAGSPKPDPCPQVP